MGRTSLFLLVLAVAAFVIISSIGTFLPNETMMPGMGGMMGERYGGMAMFLWPTILIISTAVIIIVIAYVLAFPSIKYSASSIATEEAKVPIPMELSQLDIVMRVAKADERAALEVLKNSGGVCLQKDITYKTGLSKIKTHRIVARLAERGIVQVRKVGKTNEISVPVWLKMPHSPEVARTRSFSVAGLIDW
jgi:hypothetical protein